MNWVDLLFVLSPNTIALSSFICNICSMNKVLTVKLKRNGNLPQFLLALTILANTSFYRQQARHQLIK